ncbi:hypothetical protein VE03_01022 [Pseudogymnoascus sp. 23342-1-I1]|nr:hypothetical protein VE03_01022 [Pseudogymnoascus sp. 23342-1-I1]
MSESNQQQQVSNGTDDNVQWAATHVAPAPGVVTQVRSETTTYATDGDRFVERHEVLAGPLGEEEGYVEKREGHLGVPSGGVVEEVEEGREIGLLEPEGKVLAEEAEEEEEVQGGEKEIGAIDGVEESEDVEAAVGAAKEEGEGAKEPPHSLAESPEKKAEAGPAAEAAGTTANGDAAAAKKAETGPAATVAAEGAGEAPVREAREKGAEATSTSVPVAGGGEEEDVSLVESERKRKAGTHEGEEEAKKQKQGGEGEKRGRGRPAKGEAGVNGNGGGGKGGKEKEPVEGTRRSTRSTRSKGKAD